MARNYRRRNNLRKVPKVFRYQRGSRFARPHEPRKTYRPTRATRVDIFSIEPEDRVTVVRRAPVLKSRLEDELERRATPKSVVNGSVHERIVYKELTKRRIPFDFQGSFEYGRSSLGGAVADFILRDRPVIIEVMGAIWHEGDLMQYIEAWRAEVLNAYGYYVYLLDQGTIENEEALQRWFAKYIDVKRVPPLGHTYQSFEPRVANDILRTRLANP